MPASKSKTAKRKPKKSPLSRTKTACASKRKLNHRWVAGVHTESTFPPKGLFTKDASTIARNLASAKTSPKGPASGMRMLNYYINRAGRNLPASRKAELERAKSILSDIIARQPGRGRRGRTSLH
jgi:tRNA(adenine34) deaminase